MKQAKAVTEIVPSAPSKKKPTTFEELQQAVVHLYSEVNCRVEHGADSNGHLEYVEKKLKEILYS